jgi:hypothetical protein
MNFLVVIVETSTGKTLSEYELAANNEPFARWKAAKNFREEQPDIDTDWEADCLRMD